MSTTVGSPPTPPVTLPDRWPTELPLLVFVVLGAFAIWALVVLSIVGAVYAVLIALVLFLAHLSFATHLRGSAVRLGDDQLPELYARVRQLAARAGISRLPEVYLLESGGALNALATKFLGSPMVVLYSSLLEACGDDEAARDTIIAHELAHLKAGHLWFAWLLAPVMFTPWPGLAYSRARELTCDRWAAAITGDRAGAVRGLAVLAAGGGHAPQLDLAVFARQRRHLDTGWMTIGTWLSTHPPLSRRLAALDPSLVAGLPTSLRGPARAAAILGIAVLMPAIAAGVLASRALDGLQKWLAETDLASEGARDPGGSAEDGAAVGDFSGVEADLDALVAVVGEFQGLNGVVPADSDALAAAWRTLRPGRDEPVDPCDGERYGYIVSRDGFRLWSCGPDGITGTGDDPVRAVYSPSASADAAAGLEELSVFVERFRARNGTPPADAEALYALWQTLTPDRPAPTDPFTTTYDGWYDYQTEGAGFRLSSPGPDGATGTADDLIRSG